MADSRLHELSATGVSAWIDSLSREMLHSGSLAALMADGNLGGLALGIREQDCEWEVEDADAVAAAIPARYRITYRTLANDLSIQG